MRHRVPEWYRDAKLGVMVHWGVPTVPAYAPVEHGGIVEILREHDWRFYFANNPYAEWYANSIRIPDSPARAYHRKHYGSQPYERLARRFKEDLAAWDPNEWADLFKEVGARYVVMVGKHHDGFLMWPSDRTPPSENFVASRDVVGELATAVRERGLKYGVYYSGQLDWTVQHEPVRDYADLPLAATPRDYVRYAEAHFNELIRQYSPDLLWNDIGLPPGIRRRALFKTYRRAVPDGVLNDRWDQLAGPARRLAGTPIGRAILRRRARKALLEGKPVGGRGDVSTIEYAPVRCMRRKPWELVRGIGRSFCYNAAEPSESYLSGTDLIHLLVDVVSKNGNLLLNIAPRADGSISNEQRSALSELTAWLRVHREAIYGTRPWHVAEGRTREGLPVRYTRKRHTLYAIVLGSPSMLSIGLMGLDLRKLTAPREATSGGYELSVRLIGSERSIEWRREADAVVVDVPGSFVPPVATVIEFAWRAHRERATADFYTDVI
ncbi:MAG: alpha-L-fucosidase [Spirochaetota bacterium]